MPDGKQMELDLVAAVDILTIALFCNAAAFFTAAVLIRLGDSGEVTTVVQTGLATTGSGLSALGVFFDGFLVGTDNLIKSGKDLRELRRHIRALNCLLEVREHSNSRSP